MEHFELAIFDVAGTTAKDDGLVVKAFETAARSMGVEEGSPEMEGMISYVVETMGQRKMDVFLHLFRGDQEKASVAHDRFIESYSQLIFDGHLEEFEGVSELFVNLSDRGIGVAITSGFPREILDNIVEALDWEDIIDLSVAADEVAAGRPAPDMIFKSIAIYNEVFGTKLAPEQIAVIGDTQSDMQSGVAAGAKFIVGVATGAHSPNLLFEAGATHVLESATELLSLAE